MKDVRIENVVKRFNEVTAVDGLSLNVPKGKFVTFLGPSGCGKTTTLNIIAGFENPDGGEVYVGDRLISSAARGIILPPHKRNLGMVFQSYGLWPHLTVAKNVAFGLKMRKTPQSVIEQKVKEVLRLVRLQDYADRYPSQLSGGQQQRVAVARALVYGPDVLLLDEPLSNLDAALREEMRIELKELQRQTSITTIFVTHDQMEAMVMSDLIVVMNKGRIEQVGTPRQVYETPANRFVAGFVGLSNFLEGEVVDTLNGLTSVRIGQHILQWHGTRRANGKKVLVCIRPEDWEVVGAMHPDGIVNRVPVTVERTIYMGGTTEVWARLDNSSIRIHGVHLPMLDAGSTITLRASPEDITLIDCATS